MRRLRVVWAAAVLLVAASACRTETPPSATPDGPTPTETATGGVTPTETPTATESPPEDVTDDVGVSLGDFDRAVFDDPTSIDNQWFPVEPGTRYHWVGRVNVEDKRVRHRVVFTVTDLTKVVNGVRTVVIWDVDWTAGSVVESELAFFAQDNDGNVWLMGEYPEEYDRGEFEGAPDTWIAGLDEARAGVMMRADPRTGTSGYFQGWAPTIEFTDRAKVHKTGLRVCVPLDCYEDVLLTREWNPDEPGKFQFKYYAAGVGNIRVGFGGPNEDEQETLRLVKVVRLSPEALAEVRADALEMEERAYKVRKKLYGQTPPSEPMS